MRQPLSIYGPQYRKRGITDDEATEHVVHQAYGARKNKHMWTRINYLIYGTRVPWKEIQLLRGWFVPDVNRLIRRPCSNHLPIWRPRTLEQVLLASMLECSKQRRRGPAA